MHKSTFFHETALEMKTEANIFTILWHWHCLSWENKSSKNVHVQQKNITVWNNSRLVVVSRAMLFCLQPEHTFGPSFFQMKLALVYLLCKYIQSAHPLASITNLFFIFWPLQDVVSLALLLNVFAGFFLAANKWLFMWPRFVHSYLFFQFLLVLGHGTDNINQPVSK